MTITYESNWNYKVANNMWHKMLARRREEIANINSTAGRIADGFWTKKTEAPKIWKDRKEIKLSTKEVLEQTKTLMFEVEQTLEWIMKASKSPVHIRWDKSELAYVKEKYTHMANELQMDCASMNEVIHNETATTELVKTWTTWIKKAERAFE